MSDNVVVNGVVYDHSSCRTRIDGLTETRIEEITYSHGIEGEAMLFGTNVQPQSRTRGQYKPGEVSVTVSLACWIDLTNRLGDGFGEKEMLWTIEYQAAGQQFVKDTLKACKIRKVDRSSSKGGEATVVKFTMSTMLFLENGKALFQGAVK